MTDKELVAYAKKLIDAGIQLHANYEPIGCLFSLKPSDIPGYLNDRDAFFAQECGLEKNEYVSWKEYVHNDCPCMAQGKTGPCKQQAAKTANLSPQEYSLRRREGTLVCSKHAKTGMDGKTI